MNISTVPSLPGTGLQYVSIYHTAESTGQNDNFSVSTTIQANLTLLGWLNLTLAFTGGNFTGALDNVTVNQNLTSTEVYVKTASIAKAASRSVLYQIGVALHIYYLPVVAIVGVPGNLLSLRIMLSAANRRISCCVYMAVLAVSDTFVLYCAVHYWFVTGGPAPYITRGVGYWECKSLVYIFQTCQSNAVLQIVFMTIDRFLAIRFPLKSTYLCTPKRSKIMAGCGAVYGLIFNIPYVFNTKPTAKYVCAAFAENKTTFMMVYSWLNTCMNSFIPFILLLSLNGVIIATIKKRSKAFSNFELKNVDSESGDKPKESQNKEKKEKGSKNNTEKQLTIMLLTISFFFLVFSLPQYIRYTVYSFVDLQASAQTYATYIFAAHGTNKLYFTASAVNFYLYCVSGSKFRNDVKDFIFCCKHEKKLSKSVASASSLNTVA